jgi:hypothetical protein
VSELDRLREELARITQRGIGMPIAGMIFWLAVAFAESRLSANSAALFAFVATGMVFPIGWAITRLLGGDLMHKGHPLTSLGMLLNFVQLFYWPILIAIFAIRPSLVPFVMGCLFGSHFLAYGWLYRSRGYITLGVAGPTVATILQVLAPANSIVTIPAVMAIVYLIAAVLLYGENRSKLARA